MDFFSSCAKFWKKPHPFVFNTSSVVIPLVITFTVLIAFRPFNFADYDVVKLILVSSVFSVIPVICMLLVLGLVRISSSKHFDAESWTVGKEITLIFSVVLLIAIVFFVLFFFYGSNSEPSALFKLVFLRTVLISIFPIIILVLYEQYAHQKKQWKAAANINKKLIQQQKEAEQQIIETVPIRKIRLLGENQKMALQIDAEKLVYAHSEGNYVDIYHLSDGALTKTLVRNSLKSIEEQLSFDYFFRCHRSFIVSTLHIQKVDGNARNLEITLEHTSHVIPVARSKSKELLALLKIPKS
ncbi:MAG: LytR/AlgR family response regulator transcription factor [Fluviicola sp.]